MISGLGGNVAFLITTEGVLVIDAGTQPNHGKIIHDEISKKTDKPVIYLVLTHYHGDHVGGLQTIAEAVHIAGHENLTKNIKRFNIPNLEKRIKETYPQRIETVSEKIKQMEESGEAGVQEQKERLEKMKRDFEVAKTTVPVYPDITFSQDLCFNMGEDTIEVIYPKNCHTDGNLVVWFKNQNAVHMGDMLFHKLHPFVDWKANSNTVNWMKYLKEVSTWDIEHVIPGHGDLTTKEGLTAKIEYFKKMREMVKECIDKDMTLKETQAAIAPDKFEGIGFEFIMPRTIEGVYQEMKQ